LITKDGLKQVFKLYTHLIDFRDNDQYVVVAGEGVQVLKVAVG
jgi:hypothetical protein